MHGHASLIYKPALPQGVNVIAVSLNDPKLQLNVPYATTTIAAIIVEPPTNNTISVNESNYTTSDTTSITQSVIQLGPLLQYLHLHSFPRFQLQFIPVSLPHLQAQPFLQQLQIPQQQIAHHQPLRQVQLQALQQPHLQLQYQLQQSLPVH